MSKHRHGLQVHQTQRALPTPHQIDADAGGQVRVQVQAQVQQGAAGACADRLMSCRGQKQQVAGATCRASSSAQQIMSWSRRRGRRRSCRRTTAEPWGGQSKPDLPCRQKSALSPLWGCLAWPGLAPCVPARLPAANYHVRAANGAFESKAGTHLGTHIGTQTECCLLSADSVEQLCP